MCTSSKNSKTENSKRNQHGILRRHLGGALAVAGLACASAWSTQPALASGFVLGTDLPTRQRSGPRTSELSVYEGRIEVDVAGTVIEKLDIYGDIVVRAPDVVIKDCIIRGMAGIEVSRGLIDCVDPAVRNLKITFCELRVDPRWPTPYYSGVQGHHMTVQRCYIHDVVDGIDIMNPESPTLTGARIEGNLIEDLAYYSPAPLHADNRTHNDCIQHHGGGGDVIRGNHLRANPSPAIGVGTDPTAGPAPNSYAPWDSVTGQAIGLTPVIAPILDCRIQQNWLQHGAQSLSVIQGKHAATNIGVVEENRFLGGNPPVTHQGVKAPREFAVVPTIGVTGLRADTGPDQSCGNVDANGEPVTVWRIPFG